jgi:predicted ATP-dependent serine protease
MANNRFSRRGGVGGVFNCGQCGRRTRHVGQGMAHLCPQCDEWTAAENAVFDGNYTDLPPEELDGAKAQILKLKEAAAKKGGDRAMLGLPLKIEPEPA